MVGIGPGAREDRTRRAERAIRDSEVVVGYRPYLEYVADLTANKRCVATGMRQELERIDLAIDAAEAGARVAIISSGDAGIYGMAGVLLERLEHRCLELPVEVIAGVTAASAAAALLGAPLMLDYACLSLSDQLISFEKICRRLEGIAQADLVIVLYNPRSRQRTAQFSEALRILRRYRAPTTLVGLAHSVSRAGQRVALTTLSAVEEDGIDMQTVLIVGNSTTRRCHGAMVTPRGYHA